MDALTAKKRAIRKAGGARVVAAAAGVSIQAVSQWKAIPCVHLEAVHKLTGMTLNELRPDCFSLPWAAIK